MPELRPLGPTRTSGRRPRSQPVERRATWARRGEFTIWASYLNAIKQASRYIYH